MSLAATGDPPEIVEKEDATMLRAALQNIVVWVAIAFITGIAVAAVLLAWPVLLGYLWSRIAPAMSSTLWRGVATFLLLLVGVLMFLIREEFRRLYGVAEVTAGVVTVWVGLGSNLAQPTVATLTIAGGVYIMVRGFDNLARGQEKFDDEHRTRAA